MGGNIISNISISGSLEKQNNNGVNCLEITRWQLENCFHTIYAIHICCREDSVDRNVSNMTSYRFWKEMKTDKWRTYEFDVLILCFGRKKAFMLVRNLSICVIQLINNEFQYTEDLLMTLKRYFKGNHH